MKRKFSFRPIYITTPSNIIQLQKKLFSLYIYICRSMSLSVLKLSPVQLPSTLPKKTEK